MEKNKRAESDSSVQKEIEAILTSQIKKQLGLGEILTNPLLRYNFDQDISVRPDFYSEEPLVIGEIYTHLGTLKAAQKHKLAADILKMLSFEKDYGSSFRKILVVCDAEVLQQLQGKSFLAEAIRQNEIEILLCELTSQQRECVKNAARRQNLLRKTE